MPTSSSARTTPRTWPWSGPGLALPGLHIAEVVADQAARARVGVLGTKYTMEGPLYPQALGSRGIATEIPAEKDRLLINEIIFGELVNGAFTERSRREHVRVINDLAARGCDAVALACTEIPILMPPEASPLPTLDSARLLARAALSVASNNAHASLARGPAGNSAPKVTHAAPDKTTSAYPTLIFGTPSDRPVRPHSQCGRHHALHDRYHAAITVNGAFHDFLPPAGELGLAS